MTQNVIRYEVRYSLGAGGSLVKRCKTLEKAMEYIKDNDNLNIWKVNGVLTDRGLFFRTHSKKVY
jgi:hypothetical protein